jgi:hypothetical protein
MKRIIAIGALVSALVVPTTANATVLYEPQHDIIVGSCFWLSYWYQSYSGGSRYIRASVWFDGRRVSPYVKARASSRQWRTRMLHCPNYVGTYRIRYKTGPHRWSDTHYVGIGD